MAKFTGYVIKGDNGEYYSGSYKGYTTDITRAQIYYSETTAKTALKRNYLYRGNDKYSVVEVDITINEKH